MKKALKFLAFTVFCFFAASAFAIPGITDYMPTESGQYVYYRDYSFSKETYIGFLFYNDLTLQVRYFSPYADIGSTSIELLVSLNKEKNALELSGEKIISQTTEADVDVMNYLHTLLYEFSSHRKSQNSKNFAQSVKTKEDFYQFGGIVSIVYDYYIPVFNIKSITDSDGKLLFDAVKIGQIFDSSDNSFSTYSGHHISEAPEKVSYELNKKAKKGKINYSSLTAQLDAQWTQTTENIWTLGDAAILIVDTINFEGTPFADTKYTAEEYLTRMLLVTDSDTEIDFSQLKITKAKKTTRIDTVSYVPATNTKTHNCKYLIKVDDTTFKIVSLTAFENIYTENESYFNKIISSIKVANKMSK